MTWTEEDLAARLEKEGVPFEMLRAGEETPTVQTAADALGVDVDDIVKSVLFTDKRDPGRVVLALVRGTARVDDRKLRTEVPGKWRLAKPDEVLRFTGYAAGTVPPVGHATPIPVIMDAHVAERASMIAGGGGADVMMRIARDDVKRLTGCRVASVTREEA